MVVSKDMVQILSGGGFVVEHFHLFNLFNLYYQI